MKLTTCQTCNENVYLAESLDEQQSGPNATKYWGYSKDYNAIKTPTWSEKETNCKRPFCDANCALIDYETINKREKT